MKTSYVLVLIALCVVSPIAMVLRSSTDVPMKAGVVSETRVASDADDGSNWLLNGRTFDAQHFSPLKAISYQNMGGL